MEEIVTCFSVSRDKKSHLYLVSCGQGRRKQYKSGGPGLRGTLAGFLEVRLSTSPGGQSTL